MGNDKQTFSQKETKKRSKYNMSSFTKKQFFFEIDRQ